MRRLAHIGIIAYLILALWPALTTAQPLPTLTLNGVSGDVTVLAGTLITLETEADAGIYEYASADCSGGVAFVYGSTQGVSRSTATSVSFAPFRAGNIGACRVGTWTAGPTFTLNGVEDNLSVEAGQPITFVADPPGTLVAYTEEFCSGAVITTFPSGTSRSETAATTYYVLAQWPDFERRSCRTATWTAPPVLPPATAPPLTLNGVAANATLTVGDPAFLLTDPAATISLFENADCSGPAWLTRPGNTSIAATTAGTTSFQAWWNDFPDMKSACLVGTWLDPAPIGPPPLLINGVAANATLTVGEAALFETDIDATISFYLTADCTEPATSTWSPSFTRTPTEPVTYSARAFWTTLPDVQGDCLNVSWLAESSPTPTPSPPATSTATATTTAIATETPEATEPVAESTRVTPGDPPAVSPTTVAIRPTVVPAVNQNQVSGAPVAVVTSLPSTGSGMLATQATSVGLIALIAIIGAAGAYRATSKR